jgi:hypothetical protein
MVKTAVVLAAGAATRMPNKLMLHAGRGPLILDSIHYAMRSASYVVVVVQPDSIVEAYVRQLPYKLDIRPQTHPAGVIDAISIANSKRIVVAFGDCFGYDSIPVLSPGVATIKEQKIAGLDGHNGKKWVKRGRHKTSFIGAFTCDNWNPSSDCLMTEFNAHSIMPRLVHGPIFDCGTPEGYLKLWS